MRSSAAIFLARADFVTRETFMVSSSESSLFEPLSSISFSEEFVIGNNRDRQSAALFSFPVTCRISYSYCFTLNFHLNSLDGRSLTNVFNLKLELFRKTLCYEMNTFSIKMLVSQCCTSTLQLSCQKSDLWREKICHNVKNSDDIFGHVL